MNKMELMRALIERLNEAADVYYNDGQEMMSNKEYDEMYESLVSMEKETGIVLPGSPTQRAGYEVVDNLPKEKHEYPALSLDKTKDITLFPKKFAVRDHMAVVMWKCDGSTVVATYDDGKLTKLVTRGNGEAGQVITHNAPYIKGLPMTVPYQGHMVVRGETVMTYAEFERINANLPEGQELYKNPRNLANASICMLDSKEMSKREIWFEAFNLVHMDVKLVPDTFSFRLLTLHNQGFNVVEAEVVNVEDLVECMEEFGRRVNSEDETERPEFPVDGLVVAANDVVYAESQPGTGKFPDVLVGFAFKWEDEEVPTTLRDIEWSASRTGLLNPVAVFDPVELEGTTVSRASLHNVSYILEKKLVKGDTISVYKANKIIPQVANNLSETTHTEEEVLADVPNICPVCGYSVDVVSSKIKGSITKNLWCKNPNCTAKHVKKFVHFCERDCMNIEGLSERTLEKFVSLGWLKEFADIYTLCDKHGDELAKMEGFGEKSVENIRASIEKSRNTSFIPFVHALGIPNTGKGQAKLLSQRFNGNVDKFFDCAIGYENFDFQSIEGIGEIIEKSIKDWANVKLCSMYVDCPGQNFGDTEIESLKQFLRFEELSETGTTLSGKTFVITGSLNHYENRDALIAVIESLGGKTSGSVSAKTSYLINNDVESTSGKNKKAKELGIPIIAEEDFIKLIAE